MWTHWEFDPYWMIVFFALYALALSVALRGVLFPLLARAWYNRRREHTHDDDVFGGEQ